MIVQLLDLQVSKQGQNTYLRYLKALEDKLTEEQSKNKIRFIKAELWINHVGKRLERREYWRHWLILGLAFENYELARDILNGIKVLSHDNVTFVKKAHEFDRSRSLTELYERARELQTTESQWYGIRHFEPAQSVKDNVSLSANQKIMIITASVEGMVASLEREDFSVLQTSTLQTQKHLSSALKQLEQKIKSIAKEIPYENCNK